MEETIPSIVIVDDGADIRALIRARLRISKSFDIVGEGATGVDAVRLAEEHRPALMLLDVSMPVMDGLEAIAGVVAASPATKIVMFSGFDEQGLSERAATLGAAGFVQKSLPITELAARLLEILGNASAAPKQEASHPPEGDQATLDEHLERFRAAFEQAAIGMGTLTLTGRVVRANAALRALAPNPVGSSYAELAHDATRDEVESMISATASGAQDVASATHRIGKAWVLSTTSVVRDSSGAPLYLFLQVQDVTDRRAAEEELRRSEQRFRLLIDSVADYAILLLDPTGLVTSWNLGAERIIGYAADEIIGHHFSRFYDEAARESGAAERELRVALDDGPV